MAAKTVWLSSEYPQECESVFSGGHSTEPSQSGGETNWNPWPSVSQAASAQPDITRTPLLNGKAAGLECVVLNNGRLSALVLPGRGMGIHSIRSNRAREDGTRMFIGWKSPVREIVHPSLVNLESRNGLGWLDGFSELLCRCGLASNGPPGLDAGARSPIESALTLHGRIANTPTHSVAAVIDEKRKHLELRGRVLESTLFGPQLELASKMSSSFDSNSVRVRDIVFNHASTHGELQLLYHINVGSRVLEAGSQLFLAADEIAPRDNRAADGIDAYDSCLGPTPGYSEQAYYFKPRANKDGQATALLRNASGAEGFSVTFDTSTLPYFIFWKCTQPEEDGYVVGLEPATNFPNFKAYERDQGRVISLAPKASYSTSVTLTVLTTAEEVAAVESAIRATQGDRPPVIHRTPQPGWSPAGEGK